MSGDGLRDGRYAVTRSLGEGSQGATFEAVDKKEGRLVAVKRFDVRGAKQWKDVELAEEGGHLYLVMEKIEGESLAVRLRRGGRFDEAAAVRLLRDAAEALEYL